MATEVCFSSSSIKRALSCKRVEGSEGLKLQLHGEKVASNTTEALTSDDVHKEGEYFDILSNITSWSIFNSSS